MGVTRLLLLGPFYTIQTQNAQNISGGIVWLQSEFSTYLKVAPYVVEVGGVVPNGGG